MCIRQAIHLPGIRHCYLCIVCCLYSEWYLWRPSAGLKKILEVAGTVPDISDGPPLTDNTHMSCSVLLSKLYEDLKSDAERENFNKLCEEYVE